MAEMTHQPYIFISYASSDRERVREIVSALCEAGITVWRDQEDIVGGTSYGPAIASAIRGSSAVLILCSDTSLTSRNVRQEMAIAWKHERPYLPLLLDPVTTLPEEVEYWLEGAQWIEVLDHPPTVWLPRVTDALSRRTPTFERPQSATQSLPTEAPDAAGTAPALAALPTPLTELVGRHVEIEQIRQLLDASRLVTLIGPGGTGKTRLAIEVGHRMSEHFGEGVVWVDLSPLRDPTLVMSTLATTLGVLTVTHEPILTTLIRAIGTRHLLLVTDNWEQVIDAAADLGSLLRACPHLHALATSRVALRISGEREMPIEPLTVPDAHDVAVEPDMARIRQNDAVRLFVNRAEAVKPGFILTAENAPAVIAICRRVDGLPLAIELAAARVKMLSPQVMLQRMEHALSLLTGGARDAAARQHTMRNTIQWSFDLITAEEQQLLRRLSVFVGGWTLETAPAVVDIDGDLGIDTPDGLLSLVEHSLVTHRELPDGTTRFGMLVPIREFAHEQLTHHGESILLQQRHAHTIRDLVVHAEPYLREQDEDWFRRIDREHDNIRAALTWAVEHDDLALGLAMTGCLTWFWFMRGLLSEGRLWADIMLLSDLPPTKARAKTAVTTAFLSLAQGDLDAAAAATTLALDMANALDDADLRAEALVFEATTVMLRDPPDNAAGGAVFEEALSIIEHRHLDWLLIICLTNLGTYERYLGHLDRAETFLRRALATAMQHDWMAQQTMVQWQLAHVARVRGNQREALGHLRAALLIHRTMRNRLPGVAILHDVALDLVAEGDVRAAARLLAFVDRESVDIATNVMVGTVNPRIVEAVREHLDPAEFETEWGIGRRMSIQAAVAFALEATDG